MKYGASYKLKINVIVESYVSNFDKLYAFYTAVSCKFADWAFSNIYDFKLRSPLFHQYRHLSNDCVKIDSLTQFDFESLLTTFTISLEEDVER